MNALNKVARGERTTIVVIALVAAVALVLGVGGFFMARTFLTSADSGTTASKASSDSNGGMSGASSGEASQAPDTAPQSEAAPTPDAPVRGRHLCARRHLPAPRIGSVARRPPTRPVHR